MHCRQVCADDIVHTVISQGSLAGPLPVDCWTQSNDVLAYAYRCENEIGPPAADLQTLNDSSNQEGPICRTEKVADDHGGFWTLFSATPPAGVGRELSLTASSTAFDVPE
jgi:hypothetical protein